jgi:hypothetical protein
MRVLESTSLLRPLGTSALDRHRFDANSDPSFLFDPDRIRIRILPQVFGKIWEKFLTFIHIIAILHY